MEQNGGSGVQSHIYAQLISDKSTKTNEWGSLFNQRFKDNWTTSCKWVKLGSDITQDTKLHAQWITGLDVRAESLRGKQRKKHFSILEKRWFLWCDTKITGDKREMGSKSDFIKNVRICLSERHLKKGTWQLAEGEKPLWNHGQRT